MPNKTRENVFSWVGRVAAAVIVALAATSEIARAGDAPATAPATMPALNPADLALLHRLERGSWHDRSATEAELASRGFEQAPVARAMLAQTTSPEAQVRLDAVLAQWAQEKLLGPSLITLHLKHASAKQAYTQLFRQADAPFVIEPANLFEHVPPVTVDVDRQPFWAVFEQLQHQTTIGFDRGVDGMSRLMRGDLIVPGPQAIDGQFLIVVCAVQEQPPPAAPPGEGKVIQLQLIIYPEPKTYVMAVPPMLTLDRATDNHGNPLKEVSQGPVGIVPGIMEQSPYAVYLQMGTKNPGNALADLRGTLSLQIACHVQRMDIDDITHAPPQLIDASGLAVKFLRCAKSGRAYQLSLNCAATRQDLFNELIQDQRARIQLFDTRGRELSAGGLSIGLQQRLYSLMYTFNDQDPANFNGPPMVAKRMVWNLPADIRTIDLPFDFKNMNLRIEGN